MTATRREYEETRSSYVVLWGGKAGLFCREKAGLETNAFISSALRKHEVAKCEL